jgi:hypothetical protein
MSHYERSVDPSKNSNSVVVSLTDVPTHQRKRLEFFARKSVSNFVVNMDLEAEYQT